MFSETRYALNGHLHVAYRTSRTCPRDIAVVPNWFQNCEVFPELPSIQGWVDRQGAAQIFRLPVRCAFNHFYNEELLLDLIDSGTGDPLRWSAARIARVLYGVPFYDEHLPLENVLEVPELLRAFIPFAHAESGIRDETPRQLLVSFRTWISGE